MRIGSTFSEKYAKLLIFIKTVGKWIADRNLYSVFRRCKLDDEIHIVGLDLCLVRRFVSDGLAAFFAAVDDDIALLRVGHSTDWAEYSAAFVGSVAGIHVNVKRRKTEGAVISRGVSEREHLASAIFADKARIVLFKAFFFHKSFTYTEF